jgi:hypothetical protein
LKVASPVGQAALSCSVPAWEEFLFLKAFSLLAEVIGKVVPYLPLILAL